MIKFILLGIGFIFLFEGIVYFFFASKIKDIIKILESFSINKIKSFSSLLAVIGFSIIYFTFRIYDFN